MLGAPPGPPERRGLLFLHLVVNYLGVPLLPTLPFNWPLVWWYVSFIYATPSGSFDHPRLPARLWSWPQNHKAPKALSPKIAQKTHIAKTTKPTKNTAKNHQKPTQNPKQQKIPKILNPKTPKTPREAGGRPGLLRPSARSHGPSDPKSGGSPPFLRGPLGPKPETLNPKPSALKPKP